MKVSWRTVGALLCIVGLIATWLAMAELLQDLQGTYKKPYFVNYCVRSSYSFALLFWMVWRFYPWKKQKTSMEHTGHFGWHAFVTKAIYLAFIINVSAYTWYLSLTRTSVSGNTAIYQSSSAVVFIMSVPLLKEKVTIPKVLAVAICITGVCLVAFFPGNKKEGDNINPSVEGYVLVVISTVFYAADQVVYRKLAVHQKDAVPIANAVRFIGLVGVVTVLCYWPIILILDGTNFEEFEWPDGYALKQIALNAALDLVYNALLLICITLSSPLFASVGVLLLLPASVPADYLIHDGYTLPWQAFIGVAFIVTGFITFCIANYLESRQLRRMAESSLDETADSEPLLNEPSS
ncbi:uncharacterized protein [Oscarella lobularis]|uniref:uncharacterized protein n=1 Tax=Oscarella lobularis TaxID=121494 RepID=UPI00331399A6